MARKNDSLTLNALALTKNASKNPFAWELSMSDYEAVVIDGLVLNNLLLGLPVRIVKSVTGITPRIMSHEICPTCGG